MRSIEDIIARHGAALTRVAGSYEADRSLRNDLLQEILLAIHQALPRLRDGESLAPFVFRIAHNRGVTHALRERRQRRAIPLPEIAQDTPEDDALGRERYERLQRAVRSLPLPYRQVITLVLEELTHAEIAQALGLSVSNVAVRVNRAKATLKEKLRDD